MKYIKKLNIDFNDWESLENELDNFFHQENLDLIKYEPKDGTINGFKFKPYIIIVNEDDFYKFVDYVKYNDHNILWGSGNKLSKFDVKKKNLFNKTNLIYLLMGKWISQKCCWLYYIYNTTENNRFFKKNKNVKILTMKNI